ncbi:MULTISPECIES: efflux RND transporter periplasmic adaptor subunit [Legionella]|uniref:Chemiosmotic efflux system protein B-like protein n=1 Tax=Legionella maceachernii TaxID=466 RepID=A0A0W0VVK2_9GAMM|nr:efflux RND transporter periplasmic adaptor subunit [Legionella maceachernii]KTD23965.1 chemiosmotic efflux system protein B-like protein [Legionella maceachernii]SKA19060.1 RND family efflux transporter, MFP subunit [Legionella maceachernii]SUP04435.1 Cation efflux system protein CusB precursor [Legionella maceachernii]
MTLQNNLMRNTLVFLSFLFTISLVFAHGERFEISGPPQNSFSLNPEQTKLIDLKTTQVFTKPLEETLGLNGEIQLLPNAQADVSVRISGNVTQLYANLGDKVKVGQPLLKVQSLLIGDPPPSVVMNSPMSGVIDARNVNLGQAVAPNTVLFHISDRSKLIVIAKAYEEDLGKVKVGQEARLHVLSYPQQIFKGKVSLIEPNLDPLTRTVNVQILLDNPKDLLKPGMFTRANLVLQENKDALVIPNSAIIEANNEKFVFRKQGNVYQHVVVKTGISDDNYTEILSGLAAGDEVVNQGNRQLYTYWLTGGKPQPVEERSD